MDEEEKTRLRVILEQVRVLKRNIDNDYYTKLERNIEDFLYGR